MYEQHFNLSRSPFSIAPDPSFLYLSSAHREALAHLMYGFTNGGFVMVTGEVGTGKTTLLRNLLKQTPPELDVAFILNPRLTVRELLATLCDELGIPYDPAVTDTVKQYIDLINRHLLATHRLGRSTVMIIDEAQNLSPAVLEQVRLLTNLETDDRKLLRIILIGQPELAELLERKELRQLEQRITARYHLGSLNRPDTYAYVMHRMSQAGGNPHAFSQPALRRLFSLSRGTPRIINVIADRALLGAYTEGRQQVTATIVKRAAREVLGRQPDRRRWLFGALASAAVAGAAWAILGPDELARQPEPALITTVPQQYQGVAAPAPATKGASENAPSESSPSLSEPVSGPIIRNPPPATGPKTDPPEQSTTDEMITPATYAEMQARVNPVPVAPLGEEPRGSQPSGRIRRPAGSAYANHRLAYGAVFARWGVDFDRVENDQIPCDFAPTAGLQCLSERGDWRELARRNLPVVLELWDGQAAPYYAALLALQGDRVRLQIADQVLESTTQTLQQPWSGAYVVLWQTPPSYYGNLREGQTHETVGWLRTQLSALMDRPLASSRPNYFDSTLEQTVIKFQSAEGLLTDGIVGPATWIKLAARLRLPQPSLAG